MIVNDALENEEESEIWHLKVILGWDERDVFENHCKKIWKAFDEVAEKEGMCGWAKHIF